MMYTNRGCVTGQWRVKLLRYVKVSIIRVSLKTTTSYQDNTLDIQPSRGLIMI